PFHGHFANKGQWKNSIDGAGCAGCTPANTGTWAWPATAEHHQQSAHCCPLAQKTTVCWFCPGPDVPAPDPQPKGRKRRSLWKGFPPNAPSSSEKAGLG